MINEKLNNNNTIWKSSSGPLYLKSVNHDNYTHFILNNNSNIIRKHPTTLRKGMTLICIYDKLEFSVWFEFITYIIVFQSALSYCYYLWNKNEKWSFKRYEQISLHILNEALVEDKITSGCENIEALYVRVTYFYFILIVFCPKIRVKKDTFLNSFIECLYMYIHKSCRPKFYFEAV